MRRLKNKYILLILVIILSISSVFLIFKLRNKEVGYNVFNNETSYATFNEKEQKIADLRKKYDNREISSKDISLEDMDAVPNQISATNIEQEYIQKEDKLSVYKVLHFLDEPYKEIFLLRTLGDLSFKEIADVFHKTESWARVTYHRARLKIQEALEQK